MKSTLKKSIVILNTSLLIACGGGGGNGTSSSTNTTGSTGNGANAHVTDDNFVQVASWAYARFRTQSTWAALLGVHSTSMQFAIEGFGGIRDPYNMDTITSFCGVSGQSDTQYIVTAPTVDAGDRMVITYSQCVENVMLSTETTNSVEEVEILAGSLPNTIDIRTKANRSKIGPSGETIEESSDYSYRIREDGDDSYYEAINLPSQINSTSSDSVIINTFKWDETIDTTAIDADLDVTIGSIDQDRVGFKSFTITTIDTLKVLNVPDDDDDSNGEEYQQDKILQGGISVKFDNLQVVTVVPAGELNVTISLDSNGDGNVDSSKTMPFWEFRTQMVLLFV